MLNAHDRQTSNVAIDIQRASMSGDTQGTHKGCRFAHTFLPRTKYTQESSPSGSSMKERFAELVAKGETARDAYCQTYGQGPMSDKNSTTSRLNRNRKVTARVAGASSRRNAKVALRICRRRTSAHPEDHPEGCTTVANWNALRARLQGIY